MSLNRVILYLVLYITQLKFSEVEDIEIAIIFIIGDKVMVFLINLLHNFVIYVHSEDLSTMFIVESYGINR